MRKLFGMLIIAGLFGSALVFNPSCSEVEDILNDSLLSEFGTGWLESDENVDQIESSIYFGSGTNLPASVDLSAKFPPIGNQGRYGTCVAWAVGYNLKTFLEASDKGYTAAQLSSTQNQFSPKDLFWAIPNSSKGDDCNGTNFEPALDVLVSRGIAPMSVVPYTSLGDCSSSPSSEWTNQAGNYKIDNYRKINHESIEELKTYLSQGRAIAFGARLGDNFMSANNDQVLSSDTYGYTGQHAYHALALCGYDDSKGSRGAFRVVNSWDSDWGNNGFIWVDYNFFVTEFAFCAFVASNTWSNPDQDGDDEVDDGTLSSGYDLVAWELNDEWDNTYSDPLDRFITYNVYNAGESAITASQDWNIVYIWYDAYDANNYGIIIYDYYTDNYGTPQQHDGDLDEWPGVSDSEKPGSSGNWWNNINVPSGMSVAKAYDATYDRFRFYYTMPSNLNGYYYLLLIADGFDAIRESDENNNMLYFANENGDPINIVNGVINMNAKNSPSANTMRFKDSKPTKNQASPMQSVKTKTNVNAYSPKDIRALLQHQIRTGKLYEKMEAFKANNKGKKTNGKKAIN